MTSHSTADNTSAAAGNSPISRQNLITLLEPVVIAAGFDLEDLSVQRVGRRLLLRLVVDGDSGVNLDDVAAVSSAVSALLDDNEVFHGESYTLEVTSPGVDRPLTQPRHWRRNIGRLVHTQTPEGPLMGRVVAADDSGVTLSVDDRAHTPLYKELSYEQISAGTVQLEFRRDGQEGA